MAALKKKDGYELFKYWAAKAAESGDRYKGNVHRDSAQLLKVAEHIGMERTKALIAHYHKVSKGKADFMYFLYHYDEIDTEVENIELDLARRKQVRERTRRIIEREGGM